MTSIGANDDLDLETLRREVAPRPSVMLDEATALGRALRRNAELDARLAELETRLIKSESDLVDQKHLVLNLRAKLDAALADAAALRKRFGAIE